MNKTHLIYLTGATGFVGRHVLMELVAKGYQVHCIISGKRIIEELQHPQVTYSQIDFLETTFKDELERLFQKNPPKYLIHSAWYTEHETYLTAKVNIEWAESSKILIDAFYKYGGERFIGLGTCIEYDFTYLNGKPISLNTPLKGNTLYAKCKIEVFNYLNQLHKQRGIDFTWARLFFIYGPHDKKGRLIPYIYEQIAQNKPAVPRFGGAIRDYIFVKDLAKQLVSLIEHPYQGAINLGTEGVYKIQDIFDIVGKIMHKKALIVKNDVVSHNTEYEPYSIVADLAAWRTLHEDFPLTSLKDGLAQTVAWMRDNPLQ